MFSEPRGGLGCKGIRTFTLNMYNWANMIFSAFVIECYLILISATTQFFHLGGMKGNLVLYDVDYTGFYLGAK